MNKLSLRSRSRLLFSGCAALAGLLGSPALAVTYTWSPTPSTNAWSLGSNWVGGQAPPASGLAASDIIYNGSVATFPNLGAGYSVNGLTFNAVANGYIFNAGSLTLGAGGITQNSTQVQAFQIPVSLGAASTWTLGAGSVGALNLFSGLALGSNNLTVNATGSGTIGGVISGTGSVNKTGAGTLILAGSSTFTGSIDVAGGTLAIGTGTTLTPATFSVGTAIASTVTQTGGSVTASELLFFGINAGGDGTYRLSGGTLTVNGTAVYVGASGAGRFVHTGGTLTARELQVGANAGGTLLAGSGSYSLNAGSLIVTGAMGVGYDAPGVFTQTGGSVTANNLLIAYTNPAVAGTYHLDGGVVSTGDIFGGPGTGTFNFNGGTLRARANTVSFMQNLTVANVRGGGTVIDTNGLNVSVAQPLLHSTIAGDPATDGGLTKLGAGTLTLTGASTYTGGTTIKAGTLSVANDTLLGASAGAVTILPGGSLSFTGTAVSTARTFNLVSSVLAPASGSTLTYTSGAAINGGALSTGNHAFAGTVALNGTRTSAGAVLTQTNGTLSLSNVTLGGTTTFTQATAGTLNSAGEFIATPLTTTTINGVWNVAGGYLSGAVTVSGTGRLNESGSATPLTLDGSRGVTIQSGGQLNAASGSTIELGGLLTNNGAQTGVLNVNLSGVVRGSGAFGTVNLLAASTFSASGTVSGMLSVATGALVSVDGSGRTLTVAGQFVNNGTMRFTNGARLQVSSPANQVVNTGVIDVISGQLDLPAGFVNNGVVIDSSVVRVKQVTRPGGAVAVQIDGYPGHTYRLQRKASLTGGTFADVPGSDPQANPASAASVVTLTFTDANPAAGEGFYRVVVDA